MPNIPAPGRSNQLVLLQEYLRGARIGYAQDEE
jgi:hypothetical protein